MSAPKPLSFHDQFFMAIFSVLQQHIDNNLLFIMYYHVFYYLLSIFYVHLAPINIHVLNIILDEV